MKDGYGSHREYMEWVNESVKDRSNEIYDSLKNAFQKYIEIQEVEIILFSKMPLDDLAEAIQKFPKILKPLIATCNIAARTIELDLGIKNLNTFEPKISEKQAYAIAGFIKPELPSYLEIPSLVLLDKVGFVDKEVRKLKGQWEKRIVNTLNKFSNDSFKKRKFTHGNEDYEIDAAYPINGKIKIGIDIKRIEARRDTHKRSDEIVNKANKFKSSYPESYFIACIYYPFIDEHINIQNRLRASNIDLIVFASEDKNNIKNGCKIILSTIKTAKNINLEISNE